MNASGNPLQQVQYATGAKPADVEDAAPMQNFIAPPPLAKSRASVRSSYTSLVAMVSQSDSLLPPPPNVVTPSPVLEKEINDSKAVSDLCSVLNAGEGVLISNPDAPSIARSTLYGDRRLSADDVVNAIDQLWGISQLPTIILDDE